MRDDCIQKKIDQVEDILAISDNHMSAILAKDVLDWLKEIRDSQGTIKTGKAGLPVVYVVTYRIHDDWGPLLEQEVFANESDASAFMNEKVLEGATDIFLAPRLVYMDKDRTVDIDD